LSRLLKVCAEKSKFLTGNTMPFAILFRRAMSEASFRLCTLCAHASSMVRRSSQSLDCACLQGRIRTTHRGNSVKLHRVKLRRVRELLVRCVRVACSPIHAISTCVRTTKSSRGNDHIKSIETPHGAALHLIVKPVASRVFTSKKRRDLVWTPHRKRDMAYFGPFSILGRARAVAAAQAPRHGFHCAGKSGVRRGCCRKAIIIYPF
jgi:hypothetical protein